MKKAGKKTKFSDEAVKVKTGKVWKEWFAILNKAGARKWKHSEIATYLYKEQGVGMWWCQMVAVEYEKAHGLREKFQTSTGDFAANAARTFTTPVAKIYRAWTDDKLRRKWLGAAKMEITTATKNKSVRAAWNGNKSRLSVNFYSKGPKKVALAVDHMRLGSAKEVAKMKAYWFSALNRLEKFTR
ncbi:MAG TPA: hypothetical protein VMU43_04455 [Candidatus Acidoferrum sp.]|nr:hypothetical protein [Candidatus Acidoferrum sp.]